MILIYRSYPVCTLNSIEMMSTVFGFHVRPLFISVDIDSVLKLLEPLPDEIPGGEIIRNPGTGVLCDTAAILVEKISPGKTEEDRTAAFKLAMKDLNSVGLIGVHEAGVIPDNVRLYKKYLLIESLLQQICRCRGIIASNLRHGRLSSHEWVLS